MDGGRRVMVAVAVLAAAARLPSVYTHALWEDEVASARILAEPTFPGMLRHVTRTESTPPLWYALGWLVRLAGVPIRDVRLLSVLAGAALAALVVELACRVMPLAFAAVAGLLVAFGGELVAHGSELRSYELLALLAAVFARCLLAELDAPSRGRELALAAAVAAGGLTHFFFAFTVGAGLLWLWLDPGARVVRRRAVLSIVAGGALAAAWAPVMMTQYHANRFWWIGPFRLRYVAAVPFRLFSYAYSNTPTGLALSLAALALVVAGAALLARASSYGRLFALLAVGPTIGAAAVWAGGMHIFALRNLIGTAPFVAIAAAAALAALPARQPALAVGAAAAAALALALVGGGSRVVPYNTIAQRLVAAGWRASQPVAVFGDVFRYRGPLEWYLPHQPVLDASRPTGRACRTLFVIHGETVRRLHDASPSALRHATILSDPAASPACVRPIRAGRFAALS